jgi:threonine/homoserine/homoserine lactone efflux protein
MELLVLFWIGLSTGLSGAMIPGPLFLYTISEAFHQGQRAGLKIAAGHLLLEAAFASAVVLGFRHVLSSHVVQTAVMWVGSVGLVIMGVLLLANVRRLSLARHAEVVFRAGPLVGGAFFSLTSPGFLLWWATIGASVILQGALVGGPGIAMVAVGHAIADLVWCWFVAFSVERGKAYCSDRMYRVIMASIALCLVGMGVAMLRG